MEFDEAFCKNFKLLLDRFSFFFAKRRKSVEKMTHLKKNRGHRTFKIIKATQSYSNEPIIVHFTIYSVACTLDPCTVCDFHA